VSGGAGVCLSAVVEHPASSASITGIIISFMMPFPFRSIFLYHDNMRTEDLKCNGLRVILGAILLVLEFPAAAQTTLGAYTGHEISGATVSIHAGPSRVRLSWYAPEILRLDFLSTPGSVPESSYTVVRDTSGLLPVSITDQESTLIITSSGISVRCSKYPLRFSCFDAQGRLLLAEPPEGGFATLGNEKQLGFVLDPGEHLYGTGERGTGLDLAGQLFESYNTQQYGYDGPVATMKVNVPLLLSSRGYAVFVDNAWRGTWDLGSTNRARLAYAAEGGELTCYVMSGGGYAELLERYTWLTGRQPLPPRWMLGYIQSRFGYHNEAEARSVVTMLRSHEIPCDALVLDLYWFTHMGDLQWAPGSWPTPFLMMQDFLAQGVKTVLITEPYIAQPSPHFDVATANGFFGRTAGGQPYLLQNWWSCGCPAGLLDLTRADVREWWWNLHPSFLGSQAAGLWTDLGEPERHPNGMIHAAGPAPAIHNIYNLLWAKTVADGFAALRPGRRFMNLTRSGFAGIQRFGVATWSGDVARSFSALAVQPTLMLEMGLSGLAYHHSDIGGFCCGTTTPELYIRWMQLGAFSPVMRAHGTGQPTEPWAFGEETETIVREFIRLRYRLLPYLYTLAWQNSSTGTPLLRPLVMEFPDDPAFADESSSFLLGDALLVSPVVAENQRSRTIRLPTGEWVDFWTDTVLHGGQPVTVAAPLERIPLFVRAGSLIPMGPIVQYSDQRLLDTLYLEVYPSISGSSHFELYEDDGVSTAYRDGERMTTLLEQRTIGNGSETSLTLSIGAAEGSFPGSVAHRVYLAEVHGIDSRPGAVVRDGIPLPLRATYDEMRQQGDGFFYDPGLRRLFIHAPLDVDSACQIVAEGIVLSTSGTVAGGPPAAPSLLQNYPNPFNPTTEIRFQITEYGMVRLTVFDILGREIATLVNEARKPGTYTVTLDASHLPTGTYICRLVIGRSAVAIKMLVVR
jgi:alpha-glucosidase (family GH31 glycosyl hydrolase)